MGSSCYILADVHTVGFHRHGRNHPYRVSLMPTNMPETFTAAELRSRQAEFIELLQDAVHGGASIGFVSPVSDDVARKYWDDVSREIESGTRLLLGVSIDGRVAGSVQLSLCTRQNGLHRAEVQKLFVHSRNRRRGLGRLLMSAVEQEALRAGRSLLYLDTEPHRSAAAMYLHLGWNLAGEIPDFACSPDGDLHATSIYYKRISSEEPDLVPERRKDHASPIRAKYVHTNLTARDWRRLMHFYSEVFGCIPKPPERDLAGDWVDQLTNLKMTRIRGMHLSFPGFATDGPTLEIFTYDEMRENSRPVANEPGFGHLAFAVEDVAEALKAVIAAGGSVVGEVATSKVAGVGELQVVYARDPEANIIELQRWAKIHEAPPTVREGMGRVGEALSES